MASASRVQATSSRLACTVDEQLLLVSLLYQSSCTSITVSHSRFRPLRPRSLSCATNAPLSYPMGITALWDVIKDEDRSVPIAQLAEDHFKEHGRPLRIAVDEADWRYNNLTTQQVYMIRESE